MKHLSSYNQDVETNNETNIPTKLQMGKQTFTVLDVQPKPASFMAI